MENIINYTSILENKRVAGLVVAAGMSSRMNAFKPLLKLGRKTLIEHVVDNLREGGVQEVVVVTGNRADEVEQQLKHREIHFIRNEFYSETSMFDSVKLGLEYLQNCCEEFFFLPGDIPLFRSNSLNSMKKTMAISRCLVVQPMHGGKHGHPVLFSSKCIPHFLGYDGTNGLKGAMKIFLKDRVVLDLSDKGILLDADTQEDFKFLENYYSYLNIPAPELCLEILKYYKTDRRTIEHCKTVSKVAKEIAVKLRCVGHPLNIELIEAGALLHDVARKEKEHAVCGSVWLRNLGYSEIAELVETHMDLPKDAIEQLDERAIVYLADKLVDKDKIVTLGERFGKAVNYYAGDDQAMNAVSVRMENAKKVLQSVEDKIGGKL